MRLSAGVMSGRSLKLRRNTAECRVELGANALYSRDDDHSNTGSNQAIFDGRLAGLILPKPADKFRHLNVP